MQETIRKKQRSPILAAILSTLCPGLGQIYAGDWRRGILLITILAIQTLLLLAARSSDPDKTYLGLKYIALWVAIVWVWNIWDASMIARCTKVSIAWLAILLLLLNLDIAWKVTDIHTPRLENEQWNVINKMISGITSPDVAEKKSKEIIATGKFIVTGPGAPKSIKQMPVHPGKPSIYITPIKTGKGDTVTVNGNNFPPHENGKLVLLGGQETTVATFKTDSKGRFIASFTNQIIIPWDYFIQARVKKTSNSWKISETLILGAALMFQTVYLALLGTILSLALALPLSFLGARNLMSGSPILKFIYGVTRGLFSILRSVEVLIIAVIAVAAVGVGPFAGVLALAIHGVGALGKLYSEAIESIKQGPIDAIKSTGANELQVVVYAVVPQVVPQFIAFTLYRWDINVRMATVIGLVGGGGIGFKLIQYMNLMQWRQAATAIWLIAAVVMIMDYASAIIREKIV